MTGKRIRSVVSVAGNGRPVVLCHILAFFAFFSPLSAANGLPPVKSDSHPQPLRWHHKSTHALFVLIIAAALNVAPERSLAAGLGNATGIFKVVKPPAKGARKRITIHDVARPLPPQRRARSDHGWFWQQASTNLTDASADRLPDLAAFAAGRLTSTATRDVVARIAKTYGSEIGAAAKGAGISEALLIAVIAAESSGNPKAVSSAGAQGLAQLMPGTARRFQVDNPFDPAENLRGSATYLSILLKMFNEDTLLALAGYNAGENAVIRHKGVPPFAETRDYVPIVLTYWHAAQQECATAPAGPRGACALIN